MAEDRFELIDGYQPVETVHKECVIRSATAGDVIDAVEAAEKPIVTAEGVVLVVSDHRMGLEMARRQIVRIGGVDGPLSVAQMRELTATDFDLIQEHLVKLDGPAKDASKTLGERGRPSGSGGSD